MLIEDLGIMAYEPALRRQEQAHADVLAGEPERILFVEHSPVITLGRRPGIANHLLASAEALRALGVDLVQTDRGGDITFHGPGQLVAYPILRIADHGLSVSGYVHRLEQILIQTLSDFGIAAFADPEAVGVWVKDGPLPSNIAAKIAAIGVRIRRGVSMHGLALNVTTDLKYFDLIIPCGLAGRGVTSMARLLGRAVPGMEAVKSRLAAELVRGIG